MITFIGNCDSIINWELVVSDLMTKEPGYIGPRHRGSDNIVGIKEIADSWNNSGYKIIEEGGNAGWSMYFPEKHFDKSIVEKFSDFVGLDPVNCWISRIDPGCIAPWHWDANDSEELWANLPDMVRYTCHISRPAVGHVSIIEGTCLYNQAQGNTYRWPSRKSWHAGANCGLTPKFLFNIFGHKK